MKLLKWIESNLETPKSRLLLFFGAAFVSFLVPLFYWSEINEQDWSLVNSWALFVRSSILHFGSLPLHDPWVCGGLSFLENPQNHIFSPRVILDLLFPPYWANLLTMILFCFFGIWGMYQLLRALKVDSLIAFIVGVVFVNTTWFGLHFSAGHATFSSTQLLPWVALSLLQIGKIRSQFLLAVVFLVMLLDGNVHGTVFSLLLSMTFLIFGLIPKAELKALFQKPVFFLLCLISSTLMAAMKLYPAVTAFSGRTPVLDHISVPIELLMLILFSPIQVLLWSFDGLQWKEGGSHYGFHEFGCYVGLTLIFFVFWYLRKKENRKNNRGWIFFCVFWLWAAVGWFHAINPWNAVFQKLPLINNVHLQTRVLILVFFALCVLLGKAIQYLREEGKLPQYSKWFVLLLFEFIFVKNVPFLIYTQSDFEPIGYRMIQSEKWDHTVVGGFRPYHYFTGLGTVNCYEAAHLGTTVKHVDQSDYLGEAYFEKGGKAEITGVGPGRISFRFSEAIPGDRLTLNFNDFGHWQVREGAVRRVSSGAPWDRLAFEVSEPQGEAELEFWPDYLDHLWWFFALGGVGMLSLGFYSFTRPQDY